MEIFNLFEPSAICKQLSLVSRKFRRLAAEKRLWRSISFCVDQSDIVRNRSFGNLLAKVYDFADLNSFRNIHFCRKHQASNV